jgi:hypothetical protein
MYTTVSQLNGMSPMKKRVITIWMLSSFLLALCGPVLAASDEWRHLSPKEKDTVRRNYKRWENLPPQDKNHLREEWNRFQRLPPDQRDRLRQRFNEQRRENNE